MRLAHRFGGALFTTVAAFGMWLFQYGLTEKTFLASFLLGIAVFGMAYDHTKETS